MNFGAHHPYDLAGLYLKPPAVWNVAVDKAASTDETHAVKLKETFLIRAFHEK